MSLNRVVKHRQKIADQGLKVVEVALPKKVVKMFDELARVSGTSRTAFMSKMLTFQFDNKDFEQSYLRAIYERKEMNKEIIARHSKEFTDYTLS